MSEEKSETIVVKQSHDIAGCGCFAAIAIIFVVLIVALSPMAQGIADYLSQPKSEVIQKIDKLEKRVEILEKAISEIKGK